VRVLIVDDEPAALERLDALLRQVGGVEVVAQAQDGESALAAIDKFRPDLVLLDIQMPDLSGLAVGARLPPDHRPEIVFVTAFEMFAADAFELEAVDYLLKPVRFDRLRQAIDRTRRRRGAGASAGPIADGQAIWVQTRTGSVRVPVSDIEWIEAAKDYVLLHTPTRSYLHRSTMAALEAQVEGSGLLRVHRSAFVRTRLVREVKGQGRAITAVVLNDDLEVPVGSTYVSQVSDALNLAP
jgi:two-component system LytT family response regulator